MDNLEKRIAEYSKAALQMAGKSGYVPENKPADIPENKSADIPENKSADIPENKPHEEDIPQNDDVFEYEYDDEEEEDSVPEPEDEYFSSNTSADEQDNASPLNAGAVEPGDNAFDFDDVLFEEDDDDDDDENVIPDESEREKPGKSENKPSFDDYISRKNPTWEKNGSGNKSNSKSRNSRA